MGEKSSRVTDVIVFCETENRALLDVIRCGRLAQKTGNTTALGGRVKQGRWFRRGRFDALMNLSLQSKLLSTVFSLLAATQDSTSKSQRY